MQLDGRQECLDRFEIGDQTDHRLNSEALGQGETLIFTSAPSCNSTPSPPDKEREADKALAMSRTLSRGSRALESAIVAVMLQQLN